jgi:outer membrane protein OmpA-like peptidoglycan-associated protein
MKAWHLFSITALAFGASTFILPNIALAQPRELTSFGASTPTVEQIVNAARRDEFEAKNVRPGQAVPKKALDLELTFETNSAALTAKAREQLQNFGAALNSPDIKTMRVLLEGHADARGSDEYNKVLSEKRAKAVQDYLAAQNVDPSRFQVVGVGKEGLKDPANPASYRNRRVEFVFN